MRKALALFSWLWPVYVCPCGHKARGRAAAMRHLGTHPSGVGTIDLTTGAISW